jgi:hypothetical protein
MTGDLRSDSELLADLPRQPELMGMLYERHARGVFRYLARRAGPEAAEDLVSEVFVAALSASSRVVAHDSGSALPWLYGIGLNVLRRHFREVRPPQGVAPDLGMDWDAVDERLDARAEHGRLRGVLSGLSDSDRGMGRPDALRGRDGPRHQPGSGQKPTAPRSHPGDEGTAGQTGRRPRRSHDFVRE